MSAPLPPKTRALLLVAPLVLFLVVFFAWPLWTMVATALRNESVAAALPATAQALKAWQGTPDAALEQALRQDLAGGATPALGKASRALNSQLAGFRSLLSTTARAAAAQDPRPLAEIDPRWGEPRYWQALRAAMPAHTSRHLLAALDLAQGPEGLEQSPTANRMILLRTFAIAAAVTACAALLGLPYAMVITAASGWQRKALLLAVLLPMWTSLLVRTASWFILLQNEGLINKALISLGIIDAPLPLIFNRIGVLIAMTHVLLPFMVLPIFTVLQAIPKSLVPAAHSMGASTLRAFWRITLPLALPGIMAGSLLVFMLALGYYITPALVGGPEDQMVSSVIAFYALQAANWGMAGALGVILLAVTIALYALYSRLARTTTSLGA